MDYYERKKRAYKVIQKLANNGITKDDISFHIQEEYGFPQKFTFDYYDQLKERKLIKEV